MILRWLLFFTLATGYIAAATITTQYLDSVNLGVAAYGSAGPFPLLPVDILAIATFRGAYVFTVTGGSGSGTIKPCMTSDKSNNAGNAVADLEFGSTEIRNGGGYPLSEASCQDPTGSVDV
jgi:hypothetical protein